LFSFVTKVRFGGNRQHGEAPRILKKEKMDDFFNAAPENQAPVAEAPQVADPAADFLGGDVAAVADINEAPEELTVGKGALFLLVEFMTFLILAGKNIYRLFQLKMAEQR